MYTYKTGFIMKKFRSCFKEYYGDFFLIVYQIGSFFATFHNESIWFFYLPIEAVVLAVSLTSMIRNKKTDVRNLFFMLTSVLIYRDFLFDKLDVYFLSPNEECIAAIISMIFSFIWISFAIKRIKYDLDRRRRIACAPFDRERMGYLLRDMENEIMNMICGVIDAADEASTSSAAYVEHMINCYIAASADIGSKLPYKNVKEFFCYYYPDGEKEYNSFEQIKEKQGKPAFHSSKVEKHLFLLEYIEQGLCDAINNILNNSLDATKYSAVHATNMINCYIEVMSSLGKALPYSDARGFFEAHGFSENQYCLFEESRKEESLHYQGVQY